MAANLPETPPRIPAGSCDILTTGADPDQWITLGWLTSPPPSPSDPLPIISDQVTPIGWRIVIRRLSFGVGLVSVLNPNGVTISNATVQL